MAIQKFDVTEHIRGKVREMVFNSIPDKQIDAMIKSEFDAFFTGSIRYGSKEPSQFARLVEGEVKTAIRERVSLWLSANFDEVWENNGYKLIGDMVAEFVPVVQMRMATEMAANALAELKSRLQSGY